ncbi:MAG TPA: hypothetical protein VK743_15200 [Steroidobacteraceae bacterium]|jgi:hypothetical protein|nr:hypothetical protein [Steroidobacteraceae bacterium]
MKALNNREMLFLWDRGFSLHPLDQGLLALGAALPETSASEIADWTLGRRNHALLELRCACFGSQLNAWTSCSKCAEKLEFELDAAALAQNREGSAGDGLPLIVEGQSFRLPTSRDLARLIDEMDGDAAERQLAAACRVDTQSAALPDLDEIGRRMSLADPMAEIVIELACPLCGRQNTPVLDIATFLWGEIEARAKRLLREVHTLASAYGWTEREVLSLSEQRRTAYLDMVYA